MGMISVFVGVALGVPDAAPAAIAGAGLAALHHGLAKGALFLGVGVLASEFSPRRHRAHRAALVVGALALAGFPLTSGALAKDALKDVVALWTPGATGGVTTLLSVAAAGTTVLMARLLALEARPARAGTAPAPLVVPWLVIIGATLWVAWVVPPALLAEVGRPPLTVSTLWDGLWPVLVGAAVAAGAWLVGRRRQVALPEVPRGDAVVVGEAVARGAGAAWDRGVSPAVARAAATLHSARYAAYLAARPGGGADRVDRAVTRWRVAGVLFVLLGAALVALALVGAR